MKLARVAWQQEWAQAPAGGLVFLDESAAKTNLTRLWGRAQRGTRVLDSAPAGHWGTTTMIGSVRLDGTTACMTIDDATDTDVFRADVERVLGPTLRPGDVVVMDNLAPHKHPETLRLIEATGATARCLPAYSPDFNPIEKMWSKIKSYLRGAKARTRRCLDNAIARALTTVTGKDAQGWFAACGYRIL